MVPRERRTVLRCDGRVDFPRGSGRSRGDNAAGRVEKRGCVGAAGSVGRVGVGPSDFCG